MQIKYKILFQFVFLITLVSVSMIITSIHLAREGREVVLEGVSNKLRELQHLSIEELKKAKEVADQGIMDASSLVAIDEVTRITMQNQVDFFQTVRKDIGRAGDSISKTLQAQTATIDNNLDGLLAESTESTSRIMARDSRSLDMLARVAHSNVDYLKSANIAGLKRLADYRETHRHSLNSILDDERKLIDELLISMLTMREDSPLSPERTQRLMQQFEDIKHHLVLKQRRFYEMTFDKIDLQSRIVAEEIRRVSENVNWTIDNELETSAALQKAEIEKIIEELLLAQATIRANIEQSSATVRDTIEKLKIHLPQRLENRGEHTSRIINREIKETRQDTIAAQTNVGRRIEANTRKALTEFESAIAESQKVIEQSLRSSLNKTTKLSLFIATGCGILAIVLGFVMIRSITQPISHVVDFAAKLSKGDLTERLPEGGDEMGEMSKALNRMADELAKLQQATIDSFNQTLDQVIDCVFMFDPATLRFIYVNQGAVDHLGYSREELYLMTPVDIKPEFTEESFREVIEKLANHHLESLTFTTVHLDKSGSHIPVEVLLKYVTPTGNEPRFVTIVRDITERLAQSREKERMQTELLHKQKMESVGSLAAGIAHEINTPTQFVGNNIEFLADAIEDVSTMMTGLKEMSGSMDEATRKHIEDMLEQADWDYLSEELPAAIEQSREGVVRVASLVSAMKRFSHPGSKDRVNADLNDIIETALTVSRNEWKYYADIDRELDPELPPIPLITDEMGQVILNIIINAAQAINEKYNTDETGDMGSITIATQALKDRVKLTIRDNGGGIPNEVIDKVFDPFFTTKDVGKGTGQGLAICHDVITEKHHGEIEVSSTDNDGTTFTITLPIDIKDDKDK